MAQLGNILLLNLTFSDPDTTVYVASKQQKTRNFAEGEKYAVINCLLILF